MRRKGAALNRLLHSAVCPRDMDLSPSQCGISGVESGWTSYLVQSQSCSHAYPGDCYRTGEADPGEEAESLSMVSDASSGPPHFLSGGYDEDEGHGVDGENQCLFPAFPGKKKKKRNVERGGEHAQHSYLEDTASSPAGSMSVSSKKKNGVSHEQASMHRFQRQSSSWKHSVSGRKPTED